MELQGSFKFSPVSVSIHVYPHLLTSLTNLPIYTSVPHDPNVFFAANPIPSPTHLLSRLLLRLLILKEWLLQLLDQL